MLRYQRQQRLSQTKQVPVSDVGLPVVGVAALAVGVVADVVGLECIQKLEGPVVNGQPQDAHVVGVHDAVAKAHRLPGRHEFCRALADRLQKSGVGLRGIAAGRVKVVDDKVGQDLELGVLVGMAEMLKVAKADEARCAAGDHGGGFYVFAKHLVIRAAQAQRPRGGYAQPVHGFGAQILAYRTAQHRPAVAHAGVGREPGALELQLYAALRGLQLTQQGGPAVTELAGPLAELVAAVDAGDRLGTGQELVAGQGLQGLHRGQPGLVQAQFPSQCRVAADPVRLFERVQVLRCGKNRPQAGKTVIPAQSGKGGRTALVGGGQNHACIVYDSFKPCANSGIPAWPARLTAA